LTANAPGSNDRDGAVVAPNTLVHMWLYDDVADRARKRAAMAADPEWQNYLRLSNESGYVVSQQNNLMLPAKFAPITR